MSTAHLTELLKLPALVVHFGEHRDDRADISLWEFFRLHYGQGNAFDDDRDKDMKLPFKSLITFSPTAYICSPIPDFSIPACHVEPGSSVAFSLYKSIYSSCYSMNVWHPPKSGHRVMA